MNSTVVLAAMAVVFSVGGAAVFDVVRKAWANRSTTKRASTKDLVANLNSEVGRQVARADKVEASKNAEIADLKTQLGFKDDELAYWRKRSGEQDYLLAANNIPFDSPSFARRKSDPRGT